jgi:hypothetical protein
MEESNDTFNGAFASDDFSVHSRQSQKKVNLKEGRIHGRKET